MALLGPASAQQVEVVLTDAGAGPQTEMSGPGETARAADGGLWVPGSVSWNLFRVDAGGSVQEVFDAWPLLAHPGGLAFSPDGSLYITGAQSDSVIRVDTDGSVVLVVDEDGAGPGKALAGPRGIVAAADGHVFVVGRDSDNLLRIAPGGEVVELLGPAGAGPGQEVVQIRDVTLDAVGNAYVGGMVSDNVLMVTPSGDVTQVMDASGDGEGLPLNAAASVLAAPDGTLYVASMFGHGVLELSPSGVVSAVMTADGAGPGDPLSLPVDLALAQDGTLYVASLGNDRVFSATPDGAITVVLGPSGDGQGHVVDDPTDLIVHPDGTLFVGCALSENLFAVRDGVVTHVAEVPAFGSGPSASGDGALAWDDAGALHVSLWDGDSVLRFDPDGGTTIVADGSGGMGSSFIEPTALAADEAGRVFVGTEDRVFRFDGAVGDFEVVIDPNARGSAVDLLDVEALLFDAQGRLVVAGRRSDNLLRLEPDGSVVELIGPSEPGVGLDEPVDLALARDGTIFIANLGGADVLAFRPDGSVETVLSWEAAHPGAPVTESSGWSRLVVDPLDRLVLAAAHRGEVHRLDPDGTLTLMWQQFNDQFALSVAVEDGGALLIGIDHEQDRVLRIEPSGKKTVVLDALGDGAGETMRDPRYIDVTGPGRLDVSAFLSQNVFSVDLGFCGGFVLVPGAVPGDGSGPLLTGEGSLCAGDDWLVKLSGGTPDAFGSLVLGYSLFGAPFQGGALVPSPDELLPLQLDDRGALDLTGTWPAGIPPGLSVWLQAWVAEPAGLRGYHASNGLRVDTL
jgi:outer membrane protein assembly factor BamB